MKNISRQMIFWVPRVLCILYILFIGMFSLDVFGEGHGFWKTALAFLMHNIPVLILIAILAFSWRWEWVGTLLFDAIAVFFTIWSMENLRDLWLPGPLVIIGFLFMLSWVFRREDKPSGQKRRLPFLYLTGLVTVLLFVAGLFALKSSAQSNQPSERNVILKPADGGTVRPQVGVMGTYTRADSAATFRLFVQEADSPRLHPQPIVNKPPLRWRWYSIAFFGDPGDAPGKKYNLILFTSSWQAEQTITAYTDSCQRTGRWPGMTVFPEGLVPLDTVEVVRR